MRQLLQFALLLPFALPTTALACDLCALHIAESSSALRPGDLGLSVEERFARYRGSADHFLAVNPIFAAEQQLDSSITQFALRYQLSDLIWAQASLPFIARKFERIERGRLRSGNEYGFGDASLLLGLRPEAAEQGDWRFSWQAFLGLKLPTGDSDRLSEEREEFEIAGLAALLHSRADGSLIGGSDLALGSGSYDVPLGISFSLQYARAFVRGGLQYDIRSEGSYGFEYGDGVFFNVGPGAHLVLEHEGSLSLRLRLSGDFKDQDSVNGDALDGSDQNRLFLGPELQATFRDRGVVSLSYDYVIASDSEREGVQPKDRLLLSLGYRF